MIKGWSERLVKMKIKSLVDVINCFVNVEHRWFLDGVVHVDFLFNGTLDKAPEDILNCRVDYLLPVKEDFLVIRVK